jgi:FtsH-binding integral membrane protein
VTLAAIKLPSSLDTESLKSVLVVVVLGFVVLSLLAAWLMKTIVTKVASVVLLLAIAGFVWVQRGDISDCADQVTNVVPGSTEVRCTVAGFSIKIPTSQLPENVRGRVESGS